MGSGTSPCPSNSITGLAYKGCAIPSTQWNYTFKRTGFTCNTYSLVALFNDKTLTVLINNVQVASRTVSSATAVLWVGVLSSTTSVEIRLNQTTGTSGLNVKFIPETTSPASVWSGAVSTNWFDSNNWCSATIPTLLTDVMIHNTGSRFQPVINADAECKDIIISGPRAAVSNSTFAIPAAILSVSGSYSLNVGGDWFGYGTFNAGSGTVAITGSGMKSVNCTATETFNWLVLNNTEGHITTSPGLHRISGGILFNDGIVDQNGTLQFLSGAVANNANNVSFVDGPVVKFGRDQFTFPIGTAGMYRPIGISAPALVTDNFTAQYFNLDVSTPFTRSLTDVSIHHISRCEHWILNRSGGSAIVKVTMLWDINSCGITDISDLVVARWDAGQVKWKDHGNGGTTGNTISGTLITTLPVTVFSPFTLASKTSNNILPIELTTFAAICVEEGVQIKWSTASENNNNYFIVENSSDGLNWSEITKVYSKGNSTSYRNYSYIDRANSENLMYYRLSQVDKDNTKKIFKNLSSLCVPARNEFKFYPNPASNEISLRFNVSENHPDGVLKIVDNLGRICLSKPIGIIKGGNTFNLPIKLTQGIYYISFSSYTFK